MANQRKNYSQEFKLKAINLIIEQGKPATEVAKALELMRVTYAAGFENTRGMAGKWGLMQPQCL